MSAPEFEGVNKAGAPVSQYMGIIEKGDNPYSELFRMMWYDFTFDGAAKKEWVKSMEEQNAPYSNPVSRNCYSLTSGKNHPISTAECPSVKWKVSAWRMAQRTWL